LSELPKTATAAIVADVGSPDRVYQNSTPPKVQKRKPRWAISESLASAHQHESEQDDWSSTTGGMLISNVQGYGALSQGYDRPGSSGSGGVPTRLSYQSDTFHTDNSMVTWRKRETYHSAEDAASLERSAYLDSQPGVTEKDQSSAATVAMEHQQHVMGVAAEALGRISWKAGLGSTSAGETAADDAPGDAAVSGGSTSGAPVPTAIPAQCMER
jgi:hypothetical protein